MAVLSVLQEPNPVLRSRSEEVPVVDGALRLLLKDMCDTMYAERGVGLAAVQIGVLKRLVVMDVPPEEGREGGGEQCSRSPRAPVYLVNPRITWRSPETAARVEDCLSVGVPNAGNMDVPICRSSRCTVTYLDENGCPRERMFSGLESACVQHEIDHLDGILYIDYFPSVRRDQIRRKLRRLAAPSAGR